MTCCAALLLLAAGCARPVVPLYDPEATPPAQPPTVYNDEPWAVTLRDCVREGQVDYRRLAQNPASLDAYLEHISFVGPESSPNFFKDQAARLAYYLNAFNACVLKAVLAQNVPPTVHDVHRPEFEFAFAFRVDGKRVTLADLRAKARENSNGNARIELAMCTAAMGSPPLSANPFRTYNLSEHLAQLTREAMDNPQMVQVNHETQQLLVSLAIWMQREAFERLYMRETGSSSATLLNCLMHFASGPRREYFARATGYDDALLPFDRALNSWQPE